MLERILRAIAPPSRAPGQPAGGGIPFDELYPSRPGPGATPPSYRPRRRIAWTAEIPFELAAANPARRSLVIVNDSDDVLFVSLGASCSANDYTEALTAGESLVLEGDDVYRGPVTGMGQFFILPGKGAQVTETFR